MLSCHRLRNIVLCWLRPELSSVAWSTGAQLMIFFCFRIPVVVFGSPGMGYSTVRYHVVSVKSASLLLQSFKSCCVFFYVNRDDSFTSKKVIIQIIKTT